MCDTVHWRIVRLFSLIVGLFCSIWGLFWVLIPELRGRPYRWDAVPWCIVRLFWHIVGLFCPISRLFWVLKPELRGQPWRWDAVQILLQWKRLRTVDVTHGSYLTYERVTYERVTSKYLYSEDVAMLWDMAHSYFTWDMTPSYVRHDSLSSWLTRISYETWLFHMWDMTHWVCD